MLTNEQIEDMTGLRFIARQFSAEMVIIGAAALRCFIELGRFTRDIDVAVALELDDFAAFSAELQHKGGKPNLRESIDGEAPEARSSTCCLPVRVYALPGS